MRFLFILFFTAFLFFSAAWAEETQEKLKNVQSELKKSKAELIKTKQEEQAVLGRLVIINKELKETSQSLNVAQKKIKTNETQIGALRTEVKQKSTFLQKEEDKLNARIKEAYKGSGLNYIELLLASRSMSDFFNRLYFFSKIVEKDAQLVDNIRTTLHQVKYKKQVLEKKTEEVKTLAVDIGRKKEDIKEKAQGKKELYETLKKRRQEYEEKVAELEKSSEELEALILKTAGKSSLSAHGSGTMIWPLRGRITSNYGYRRHPLWGGRHLHTGLDIAAKYGTPISAADNGEVIFSGWWDGYGKAIVIDHGKGTTTVYGHLSRIYKNVGASVTKGQTIGLVGNTGYSTGPHLHFEVRKNGKHTNPIKYLP